MIKIKRRIMKLIRFHQIQLMRKMLLKTRKAQISMRIKNKIHRKYRSKMTTMDMLDQLKNSIKKKSSKLNPPKTLMSR